MIKKSIPSELVETRPVVTDEGQTHPAQGLPGVTTPIRYSTAVHDSIVDSIRKGNRPKTACAIAGIPYNDYLKWMRMGHDEHPIMFQFALDVEQAIAGMEEKAIKSITEDGAFTDAENAKWYLERRHADGYSKETHTKVNAMLAEFLETLERGLPPDVFKMVIAVAQGQSIGPAEKAQFILNGSSEEDGDV